MVTIAAKNGHFQVSVFRGHRCQFHFVVQSFPHGTHVHHGHAARRTRVVARLQQLLHALKMQHVTAFRHAARFARRVKIFQANGTVGPRHLLDALVVVPHRVGWEEGKEGGCRGIGVGVRVGVGVEVGLTESDSVLVKQ